MPPLRSRTATLGIALVLALVLSAVPVHGARPAAVPVLALYQTPGLITPEGTFTLSMQVADPSSIQAIYFTFCQLTSPLCYLPIPMVATPAKPDWFVGTTNPMTAYPGMVAGVSAGYNITILFNDNSTFTEPSLPNAFSNLTLNQTVTQEYVYQITVENMTFGIGGRVVDSATGAGVAGANVTLTPGAGIRSVTNATGVYSLPPVQNGSYSLAISRPGYQSYTVALTVAGPTTVQDVRLNATTSPKGTGGGGGGGSLLSSPTGLATVAGASIVLVLAAALGIWGLARRRRSRSMPPSEPREPSDGSGGGA